VEGTEGRTKRETMTRRCKRTGLGNQLSLEFEALYVFDDLKKDEKYRYCIIVYWYSILVVKG
jgi:hypothetical protein